ncbi:MAG: NAD-dependent epimerase/dehydratase [Rubritepida sp.]|nr:NAD-dependent epimerase/dehydratase [Rubritepida sp.]
MIPPESLAPEAAASLRNRSCLVLGGGGFLGTHLCNALAALGARVHAFGRSRTEAAVIDRRVHWTAGEFNDIAALAKVIEGQETVFHLISASVPESSNRDPAADLSANTIGTLHLLELLRSGGVQKLIFTSSGGTVYGVPEHIPIKETAATDPISAYGISKLATEKYLALYHRLHGLDYRILRVSNPYGRYQAVHRRQGVVGALLHRAVTGEPLEIWGTGDVTRDFIHVEDVVAAMLSAHAYQGSHRLFNVGSGHGMSIREVADSVERALGRGPLERNYMRTRAADVPVNILDTSLIQRETGWRPRVDWEEGLADTLSWVSAQVESAK